MLCYPSINAYYLAFRYVEEAGYEVILNGIDCALEISLIDKMHPQLLEVEGLIDFDIIAITIEERNPDVESPVVSKEFIRNL